MIYFIDGYGGNRKNLAKRFNATLIYVNWRRPISEAVIKIKRDDVIIGFSLGAVVAYLVAKKSKARKAILCSMTPLDIYSYKQLFNDAKKHMTEDEAELQSKELKELKIRQDIKAIYIAGEKEKQIYADILVPNTRHELNDKYIKVIHNVLGVK
jgi:esterase/lipase